MTPDSKHIPGSQTPGRIQRLFALRWAVYRCSLLLPALAALVALGGTALGIHIPWYVDLLTHFMPMTGLVACIGIFFGSRFQRGIAGLAVFLSASLMISVVWNGASRAPLGAQTTLKVATANVQSSNDDYSEFEQWLQVAQPDVIAVLEVSPGWEAVLQRQEAYPYRHVIASDDNFGIGVLSKFPLEATKVFDAAGTRPPSILATVRPAVDKEVHIVVTHPVPPMSAKGTEMRNQQMVEIARIAKNVKGPFVVLGDLNATPWSQGIHPLTAAGLRMVDPLLPTWPAKEALEGVEVLRLDHILVSRDVRVVESRRGPKISSDHRPVEAALMF